MWASRLTSTGARKYVSLLFMNLMASDGLETYLGPRAAFQPMRVRIISNLILETIYILIFHIITVRDVKLAF